MSDVEDPGLNEAKAVDTAGTIIRVVGVGGGGGNAVNRMIDDGLNGVDFIAINTDSKDLARNKATSKVTLSGADSRGLGAGGDPAAGKEAAEAHQEEIQDALAGSDMVFVTCGEGGGTGTGASPVVAHIAHELGALTIAVVTRPFAFEARRRMMIAERGIESLSQEVDAIIVIPNEKLLTINEDLSVVDAFKEADGTLTAGVRGITDLITNPNPYINVDFADVKSTLKGAGTALFGIGDAADVEHDENKCYVAAEKAVQSPLLEHGIEGAHSVVVNFAGPTSLRLKDVSEAMNMISDQVSPEAAVTFGLTLDDQLGDSVRVTIVAGGFELEEDGPAEQPQTVRAQQTTRQSAVQPRRVETPAPQQAPARQQQTGYAAPVADDTREQRRVYNPPSQVRPSVTPPADDGGDDDDPGIPSFLRGFAS